jgi:hypothetical protein
MQRVTFLATTIALLFLVHLVGDTAASAPPRFGIVEAFWSPEQAADLGADWERILFYWSELQPTGPDDWNTLHVMEEWLGYGEEANREIIGLIKHTPSWATDGADYSGVPRGLYLPIDDPENLWATFLRGSSTTTACAASIAGSSGMSPTSTSAFMATSLKAPSRTTPGCSK